MQKREAKITEEIRFSYLMPSELNVLSDSIISLVIKYKVDDPFITGSSEVIKEDIDELNKAMKKVRANEFTAVVQQKKIERKDAYQALKNIALAAKKRKIKEVHEAASRIVQIFKTRGLDINTQSSTEITSGINLLIEDLQSEQAKKDIAAIKAGEYMDDLIQANNEYKNSSSNRQENEAQKDEISLEDSMSNIYDDLIHFIGAIELLAVRFPGQYNNIIKEINEAITQIMTGARARRTRDKNNSNDEETKAD